MFSGYERGEQVYANEYLDGDASGGISLVLRKGGSQESRTLGSGEYLCITDIFVSTEDGGDIWLDFDADDDDDHDEEDIIVAGNLAPNGGIVQQLRTPLIGPAGATPKFYGVATGLDVCCVRGFILKT